MGDTNTTTDGKLFIVDGCLLSFTRLDPANIAIFMQSPIHFPNFNTADITSVVMHWESSGTCKILQVGQWPPLWNSHTKLLNLYSSLYDALQITYYQRIKQEVKRFGPLFKYIHVHYLATLSYYYFSQRDMQSHNISPPCNDRLSLCL